MSVEVTYLGPDRTPPTTNGTLLVRFLGPGRSEVLYVGKQHTLGVYSSQAGSADDLALAIKWAVDWAASRKIARVYVSASSASGGS